MLSLALWYLIIIKETIPAILIHAGITHHFLLVYLYVIAHQS